MSEFWKRKLKTYFNLFDFNKDGIITEKEYVLMAERFADVENAEPARKRMVIAAFDNVWRSFMHLSGSGDNEGGVNEGLTVPKFVESVKIQKHDPKLRAAIESLIRGLFDIIDSNEDGFLQEDEFRKMFQQLGVPDTTHTKMAFQAIDTNHDGKLSVDEYIYACNDFFFSEDEDSPFRFVFGPLV